jgi:hypothetical protein
MFKVAVKRRAISIRGVEMMRITGHRPFKAHVYYSQIFDDRRVKVKIHRSPFLTFIGGVDMSAAC